MILLNILGTNYTVEKKEYSEDATFKERGIDGYCDEILKKITYCDMKTHPIMVDESEEYCTKCENEILRHEIVHAFLNESGLMDSSFCFKGGWSQNEEMVDWIAMQFPKFPKIYKVFSDLDIL